MDRSNFEPIDSAAALWRTLNLPDDVLTSVRLVHDNDCLPSSFKVDHLAQSSIAISALAAALFYSINNHVAVPMVTVPIEHACVEFSSERLYTLNGEPARSEWGTLGGLHKTTNGYVKMHDSFPNHRQAALRVLGLEMGASRDEVAKKMLQWKSVELEAEAFKEGAVILALRSFDEWDTLPQARAVSDTPILLRKVRDVDSNSPRISRSIQHKCLSGIRVVEMSRVIAAPVAGRTLAAHGAEVIWITSPTLPDQPGLDRDVARGKRTVRLDIKIREDKEKLLALLHTADVFIQSYRPGSLAAHGLSSEELSKVNPNLIVSNLSAWGPSGPWSKYRGFDSLVQTCSGINVADAERYGADEAAHVLPCQALDHSAGYFLATGIITALCKRATKVGIYEVNVSLAGVGKYLRSLGQRPGKTGFARKHFASPEDVEKYLETRPSGFGELSAVRHSAQIEGVEVGWDVMPKPLGSDEPTWRTPISST